MKKLIFLIVIMAYCQILFSQNNVVFMGHISNSTTDSAYLSNIWGKSYSTTTDSKGNFVFTFEDNSEGFYNFSFKDIFITIYLSLNDTLVMDFDYADINSSIEFKKGKVTKFNKSLFNLSKGKPAPDFTLRDINENDISLSTFKGKYVYIDVWASYCGGCIKEIPYFEKLKEDFKDKNIVFLSISGDAKEKKWLKVINKRNMTGIQLINQGFKSDFSHKYLNYGSPRYILIDKEQKIINANAPKPSDIDVVLNNLEGI